MGLSQFVVIALYGVGFRFITEWYSPAVLGEATLYSGALTLTTAIAFQPIFSAHVRLFPEYRERGQLSWFHGRILAYLGWLALGAASLAVIGTLLHYLSTGETRAVLMLVMVVALMGQTAFTFKTDILSAMRQQTRLAGFRILRNAIYPLAALAMAVSLGPNVLAFLAGTAISFWLPPLLIHSMGWARIREAGIKSPASDRALLGEVLSYGTPLAFLGAANWATAVGDRYVLAFYLSPADVGVYSAIYGLFSQPFLALAGGLVIWLRPLLFDAAAGGRRAMTQRILWVWIGTGGALSAAGGALLWMTRAYWLRILLAEPYRQDGPFLAYILFGYSCHVVSNAITYRLMVARKTLGQFVSVATGAITNIGLNMVLVPQWGLNGAGLATALSFLLQTVLLGLFVWRLNEGKEQHPDAPPAASS